MTENTPATYGPKLTPAEYYAAKAAEKAAKEQA